MERHLLSGPDFAAQAFQPLHSQLEPQPRKRITASSINANAASNEISKLTLCSRQVGY